MYARPDALLLDFGGVVIETHKRPAAEADIAEELHAMVRSGGHDVPVEAILASYTAGAAALKHWKHASSRRSHPQELTHREIVDEFLAGDLPDGARALLTAEATSVLAVVSRLSNEHPIRPGVRSLLTLCAEEGIAVGIVSNAHSGTTHRQILAELGIADLIGVQVYSDEVGIRKPNPEIIQLAAEALGVSPERAWYVGDTQDRDVAAGRRAGVGSVLITRSKHTDNPPFAVTHRPDAVFDDPRGVLELLTQVVAGRSPTALPASPVVEVPRGPAVLIDHGGVISQTAPGTDGLTSFLADLALQLRRARRDAPSIEELRDALARARAAFKTWKEARLTAHREAGEPLREVTHREFWEAVADQLDGGLHSWFRAEADDLAARYGNVKSDRTCRPGMGELLRGFAEEGTPVVVVSNTVSGRAVRDSCARYGLAPYISAYVCSDEMGLRKPEPGIFLEALTIAHADPARTIFIGDKPRNDAAGALAVGIAHRVLLTGGSTPASELEAALADGTATQVVTDLHDLHPLREAIAS